MPRLFPWIRALGLLAALTPPVAEAASSWNGLANDGKWYTSGNWSGLVPDLSIDATFGVSGSYGVSMNADAAAKSLKVSAGQPSFSLAGYKLSIDGALTVNGALATPPTFSLAGGPATATSAFIGQTSTGGALTLTGSTTSLTVGSGGMFVGYNRTSSTSKAASGTLNLSSGASLTSSGFYLGYSGGTAQASVDNASLTTGSSGTIYVGFNKYQTNGDTTGTLTVTNGGVVTSTASITTSVIGGQGGIGTVSLQGTNTRWTHRGNIYVGGSNPTQLGTGILEVTNGASLTVTDSVSSLRIFNNGGTLKLSGAGSKISVESIDLDSQAANFQFTGGTLELNNTTVNNLGTTALSVGGTMTGTGTINGKVNVTSTGVVSPGTTTAPGSIRATGNFTSLGKTEMRLFNVNSAGKLIVDGSATLNGTVSVQLMNGYSPALGTSFDLLDFVGPLAGVYGMDFSAAPLPAGQWWDTSLFASSGVVSVQGTPEPGTLLLGLLAAWPVLGRRRRRLR